MYRSRHTQNIIQAIAWIGIFFLFIIGTSLMNGCSQDSRYNIEDVRNLNPRISHTWRF